MTPKSVRVNNVGELLRAIILLFIDKHWVHIDSKGKLALCQLTKNSTDYVIWFNNRSNQPRLNSAGRI